MYRVLSDPEKREEYHRLGAAATEGGASIDPKALFALMFSDFEHIVGDLATSTILASMGTSESTSEDMAGMEEAMKLRRAKKDQFQAMREKHLIELLERRLEPWMAGDEDVFIQHAKREVLALRKEPFGRDCLKTVGYMYRKKASAVLHQGKGPITQVSSFFDSIGDKAHSIKSQLRALEGGVKAISSSVPVENEPVHEAARREAVQTLGAVWLASVVDIESTVKHVLAGVLKNDTSDATKRAVIKRRAEGLLVLGKIFEQA